MVQKSKKQLIQKVYQDYLNKLFELKKKQFNIFKKYIKKTEQEKIEKIRKSIK